MAVAHPQRPSQAGGADPAEGVATVLAAKQEILLRAYRGRLPHEDLEDCLAQAALELVARARAGGLEDEQHVANALEQKFASRIIDRRRSIARRGEIAVMAGDAGCDEGEQTMPELVARDAEPSEAATRRGELERLREVAAELTEDQRLVLACQVSLSMDSTEFCERFGWSPEKFRKVAQRARAKLRALLGEYELGERCRRLEADVLAYAAHAASAAQAAVVREHLANCVGCAAMVRDLRLASGRVGALLPVPALANAGLGIKLALAAKAGAMWRAVTEPIARLVNGAGSGAAESGGGLAKAGVAALCAATLAGGGHWVAPRLPHRGSRAPAATRASAAPAGTVGTRRSAPAPEPVFRPALVLTHTARRAVPREGRPKRARSHRRAKQQRLLRTRTPVAPPAPRARPPVRTVRQAVPRPRPAPSHAATSTDFGVE